MKECVTHHHACDCREEKFAKLEADLAAARREIDAIKTRFEHECSDVDRIVRAIGVVTAPRTECGSLRVNDIVRHINETLDALAAAHSASVDFSNKYAAAQRELAAWQKAVDDYNDPRVQHIAAAWWIKNRVAELLAQDGIPAQPQYRDPMRF